MKLLHDGGVVLQVDGINGAVFAAGGFRVHGHADAGVDGCDAHGTDADGVVGSGSWGGEGEGEGEEGEEKRECKGEHGCCKGFGGTVENGGYGVCFF